MTSAANFLFAVCQRGAEWALKDEVVRRWPRLHFAYSRPGFVTFKDTAEQRPRSNPLTGSVYARTCSRYLGKSAGDAESEKIDSFWELAGNRSFDHLHIWQRDAVVPGEHGYVPGPSELARAIGTKILAARPDENSPRLNELAHPGDMVLDCVIVEPTQWWMGLHQAESVPQRWPGGVPKLAPPDEMISRAYLKTSEALAWSRLPAQAGDRFVELGCAPGGSSKALLDRGFHVTGIDPAEVDSKLRGHTGFVHIRKRSADLRRKEFRAFRWLVADLNVAPNYTLAAVEDVVTYDGVNIAGILLTLKLMDREHYSQVETFLSRVRGWGYEDVRARQLAFNRQEICIAGLRSKSLRRPKK